MSNLKVTYPVFQAWRPAPHRPMLASSRTAWRPLQLPSNPKLGLVTDLKSSVITVFAIPTLVTAAASYVGFKLGATDKGLPAVLGYTVGVLGALGTLLGVAIMVGLAAIPWDKKAASIVASLPQVPPPVPTPGPVAMAN